MTINNLQQMESIPVTPLPLNVALAEVSNDQTGERFVLLRVSTPQGESVFFLPLEMASQLASELGKIGHAGLTVVRPELPDLSKLLG